MTRKRTGIQTAMISLSLAVITAVGWAAEPGAVDRPLGAGAVGRIALSFDDAPWGQGAFLTGSQRTDSLIIKLLALDIKQVVFFCVTERLGFNDGHQRLQQYSDAGFLLGNHSHTHPEPPEDNVSGYVADIIEAHDSLKQFAGFVPWFRYPRLDEGRTRLSRDAIRAALDSLGYRNGYVTVDTWDWYLAQRCREARRAGKATNLEKLGEIYVEMIWGAIMYYDSLAREILHRSPDHVLLLHENDLAALYIDDLVRKIRSQGWSIISPAEAYRDTIAAMVPDVLENNQGRIVALARERGYQGPGRHHTENAAYIDSVLSARGIFGP